jgi:hypothetical protein
MSDIPCKAVYGKLKEASKENSNNVTFHTKHHYNSYQQSPSFSHQKPPIPPASCKSTKNSLKNTRNQPPFSKYSAIANLSNSGKQSKSSTSFDNKNEKLGINLMHSDKFDKLVDTDAHKLDSLISKAKISLGEKINAKLHLHTNVDSPDSYKFNPTPLSNKSTNGQITPNSFDKWKQFGLLMADAYEELKSKYKALEQSSSKSTQIIEQLRDQNCKLKTLLSYTQKENSSENTQYLKAQIDKLSTDVNTKNEQIAQLHRDMATNKETAHGWEAKYNVFY